MIEVKVFSSNNSPGISQFLYPVTKFELENLKPKVLDDYDHSYFYYDAKTFSAKVRWFNKNGEIQLCGSGAYAVAKYLLQKFSANKVHLITCQNNLSAYSKNSLTHLVLPLIVYDKVEKVFGASVYSYEERGLYFFHLKEKDLLVNVNWQDYYEKLGSPHNIHGIGFFCLEKDKGWVRYFVPWHGREEDYVTGSIHQYLGIIASRQLNLDLIHWQQLSTSPGELKVEVLQSQAIITEVR